MTNKPKRPIIRYYGGKWRLASWIISHFPKHRIYVEPYGGAGSVLLQKPRSYAEIYNELDEEVVSLFEVVRDKEKGAELKRLLKLTPYARKEFENSYIKSNDPIEQARRTIVRAFMGYGSDSVTRNDKTGFRANNLCSGTFSSSDWKTYPDALKGITERMQGVVIESLPALDIIKKYDSDITLFYVDPPYLPGTCYMRLYSSTYRHTMTIDDHKLLAEVLLNLKSMVVLSGYSSELYNELFKDWTLLKNSHVGQAGNNKGSKINTECLWISPNTVTNYRLEFKD